MSSFLFASGCALLAMVALARLFCLGRWRAGWAMYLANVVWETFPKKLGIGRFGLEAFAALLGLVLLGLGGTPWIGVAGIGTALLALEAMNRLWERRMVGAETPAGLILTVEAPFIARLPRYRLGMLRAGAPFEIELIVSNPAERPTATALQIRLEAPAAWLGGAAAEVTLEPLPVGGLRRAKWTICPAACSGSGSVEIVVDCAGKVQRLRIGYDGCRPVQGAKIARAEISRYPGGRRCALAWRGDMDLYDTLTWQSIEGLEVTLGLAARYAFPQTMCLSTRLSFDEAAAREWAAHDGRDHGAAEIPRFIAWLKEKVELRHAWAYPMQSAKAYGMELGNHGHLHYDTATSAAPENGWKSHARMGAGRYPWTGADASSFGEQRDNIQEAARWCQRLLGFTPRSWAKPGRCNDADTARAAEAAGCEVVSGSDIRARDNVLFQPPPHHPGGTGIVELTTRHPCDPQHIHHFGMLLFWLHRSQRLGLPMVFMCHQHMRQFEGKACSRLTEHFLRRVLLDFNGEFRIDTLFGVGKYWREVLSPRTRRVAVSRDGGRLVVENRSDMDFEAMPVDLEWTDGARSTVLVSIRSGETIALDGGEN